MTPVVRVGVVGARGKMGRVVSAAVSADDDTELVAEIGRGDPLEWLAERKADVAVDFTLPDAVMDNVRWYLTHGVHAVVGTTGMTAERLAEIKALAERGPANAIVAPNFTIGVLLMIKFAAEAAKYLPDVEIIELHGATKKDKPSGTSVVTAEAIARVRGRGDVPIHSVRLPGLFAHQEVVFGGPGQTLSIRHDSLDRAGYMPGVMLAVKQVAARRGLTIGLEPLLGIDLA